MYIRCSRTGTARVLQTFVNATVHRQIDCLVEQTGRWLWPLILPEVRAQTLLPMSGATPSNICFIPWFPLDL